MHCKLSCVIQCLQHPVRSHQYYPHWLGAGGEGDDRGWDGWIASLTQWTWVWVNSGSWWWTGRPGVLWFMGSQRVRHDWATELDWTELNHGFGKIPWRRERLPTPVFWPREFPGSMGSQRVGHGWATFTALHFNHGLVSFHIYESHL